ncbi:hypothetical protein [Shimia abyssi]|uniref:Uncharacterized protein n=1 Tax=Shimia abyssi TaxID=1662395 RepID=A0A2P8FJN4_9RHOB|nr:hypothetical protein [Shimia abyssi]PSL21931.1 hypothetical protein CLV88_101355 [Shimia abyssi]
MVEIADIQDRKSLEAWLKGQSQHVTVAIAQRAASRVLPLYWHWCLTDDDAQARDLTALPLLRAVMISGVACKTPTPDIKDASFAAADASFDVSASAASFAADAASFAAADASFDVSASAASFAADAASFAVAADAAAFFAAASDASAKRLFWDCVRRDAEGLAAGGTLSARPLWHDSASPFRRLWDAIVQAGGARTTKDQANWTFWIAWYQAELGGVPMLGKPERTLEMLSEIALIDPDFWDQGPDVVNPRIREIWQTYKTLPKADPAELLIAENLLQASLSDFKFDTVQRLMRMEPFAQDLKFLEDTVRLATFLEDAEDLCEDIDLLSMSLERQGRAVQGAGYVRTYLDAVSVEFSKARQMNRLNVGKVVKYGHFLQEASLDAQTRKEFGSLLSVSLDGVVDGLANLVRTHFGATLLRFAPLEELELEADTNAWEYLNELRHAVQDLQEQRNKEVVTPLDEEGIAVLKAICDEIERTLRAHGQASGEVQDSLQRELNYRFALLTVSLSLYAARARQNAGTLSAIVEGVLKAFKQAKGLYALWDVIRRTLLNG